MKKIVLFSLPIMMLVWVIGCSKDHDAPTFSKYKNILKPTNVVATYDPATDTVNLTWEMTTLNDVTDFYVTVSDSMDFKSVNQRTTATGSLDKSFAFDLNKEKFLPETTKQVVLWFTVSALYNSETLRHFFGPVADDADSATIARE